MRRRSRLRESPVTEVERLREKILETYPQAVAEFEDFKNGMRWLEVWLKGEETNERRNQVIIEAQNPDCPGFGFTDMSYPNDERHIMNSFMDEYGLDFDTVFRKACEILGKE